MNSLRWLYRKWHRFCYYCTRPGQFVDKSFTYLPRRLTGLYYRIQLLFQYRRLHSRLKGHNWSKTVTDSKNAYDGYGAKEINQYVKGSTVCVYQDKVQVLPYQSIRAKRLDYIIREIQKMGARRVLEVGCGNCLNLLGLAETGMKLELSGLDVSANRIQEALKYYDDKLSGITLRDCSITRRTPWEDKSFDAVFTVHCLEQIGYETEDAIREMLRLTDNLILVEPVFEVANMAQKLFMINSDHNRILLKSIKNVGASIVNITPLDITASPLNPSCLVVVRDGK